MKAILRASLPLIELPVNALHWSTHRMIFAVHCLSSKIHFMAFRFQLTCGSNLLMPRGPTAVALLPSNVKPYFRRDFFSSRFHFHQGRFFSSLSFACSTWRACLSFSPVSPSTISNGRDWLSVLSFFCALSSMLFRAHFAFYITFHFFRCSTCFFYAYFAWGRAII